MSEKETPGFDHRERARYGRAMTAFHRLPPCLAVALVAVLIALPAPPAVAQDGTPGQDRGSHAGEPGNAPGDKFGIGPDGMPLKKPDAKDAEARKKAERRDLLRLPGQTLPNDPGARDKLLESLYAHLATAETEEVATRVALGINQVWMHSGSDTVSVLMSRASSAVKQKETAKALRFLTSVVRLAPAYAEGWNQRAFVHYQNNDITRAMGDLRRVLALDPNHYKAMEGLGQILRELDQKPAALKVFKALIAIHPFADGVQKLIDQLNRDVGGQEI